MIWHSRHNSRVRKSVSVHRYVSILDTKAAIIRPVRAKSGSNQPRAKLTSASPYRLLLSNKSMWSRRELTWPLLAHRVISLLRSKQSLSGVKQTKKTDRYCVVSEADLMSIGSGDDAE